jgi:restriction endonuclease Mrr
LPRGSGGYRVTDQSRKALAEQPERIDIRFLERYPTYIEWRRRIAEAAQEARG